MDTVFGIMPEQTFRAVSFVLKLQELQSDQGTRHRYTEKRRSRPAGQGNRRRAWQLGFDGVSSVRQGKVFDLELEGSDKAKAEADLKAMCEKLLANTVIEDYSIAIA
ncbi:phosphoribosylformylglycinamidine synthase subunit PurS [Brucella ceti TE28753-12]|nr:phosphoribosylformylglycinamidine synthase subunit PurS [Brucella ceti]AHB02143.1 phosphoribosylformylglycinamidine synthase subunit PurS [Brucella ceti TE28753-12]